MNKTNKKEVYTGNWVVTKERTYGNVRYGVYNEKTGDMKVMGLGLKGRMMAQDFRNTH